MTSLKNNPCQVPCIKFRINKSSTRVSDGLLPSFTFAERNNPYMY